jgi:beta-lactamase regulating signal transducer with metallopeptidase domain
MNAAVLFAVTVLVNAVWQPALIAVIAWTALKISRCSNATTRHAVWSLALVASFIVPFISAMPIVVPHGTTGPVVTSQHAPAALSTQARTTHQVAAPAGPVLAVSRPSFRIQPTAALIAAGVWLVVALAILTRLLISLVYLNRLKHDALPLAVESRHALIRYDRAHKGDRDVRICVSHEITVPVAVGIFDAMILIPSDLVHELDANDLDRILLHELAHVRRSDDWVNLFERVVQALFFFSPGIYWISRQMDLEREVACDDWVLEQSAENVPYARCLARIVEMTQWPYTAPAAPGVFVTRKSMSIRIERLLARGRDIRVRLALVPSLLSLVFIVAVVIAGGFVSPTIAYTLDHKIIDVSKAGKVGTAVRQQTHVALRHNEEVQVKTQYVYLPATPAPKLQQPSIEPIAKATVGTATVGAATVGAVTTGAPNMVADASYLDDLAAAGYTHLSPYDVIELKSVGVTGQYIRDLQRAGLKKLSVWDLVSLKSLGVDGAWVAQMRAAGLTDLTPHNLEGLKSLGVDGDYVSQMRTTGLTGLDARDLEGLKSLGVDGNYISQMRAAGLTALDAHEVEGLKSLGVDGEYIKSLANVGYPHLSALDLEGLKSLGVDSDYIAKLRSHGFTNLTVRQLETFKSQGVEPQ